MNRKPIDSSRRSVPGGLAMSAAGLAAGEATATGSATGHSLPRTRPEAVGIDPAGVLGFLDAVEQSVGGLHSFMLLRQGRVAAEGWWAPYAPQYPHMLFSLSKSFTSTAVGLAVNEGHLTVDAPVISFFPNELPEKVGDNLAAMRVRHLLSMSTGHDKDATGATTGAPDGDWIKAFLALPVEHEPGTHFVYNSAATFMLSAIVQKLTSLRALDYLTPRLFGPLGIEGPTWETNPQGIDTGGWGLSIRTEDIARFGQLYLQKGVWHGKQLVPASWVEEATSKHISNGTGDTSDWAQGYGYQFWRCRHNCYRGDGAFGQYCVVMPEQNAVLAITSGVGDMQAVLNAAWDHLLPALHTTPLAESAAGSDLRTRLGALGVRPPEGAAVSAVAQRVSGRSFELAPNDEKLQSVTLTFTGDRCHIAIRGEHGTQELESAHTEWVKGTTPIDRQPKAQVAVRGAWPDENTYTAKLCYYETPFIETMTFRFSGDDLTLERKRNVGFGPTERPTLTGRATVTG